jgi:hypothetical protein
LAYAWVPVATEAIVTQPVARLYVSKKYSIKLIGCFV